jgi:hypothetical protein
MNIKTLGPRVVQTQVFLHLADSANSTLKNALDENTLLGVHHLVVTGLQLAVYVDVLDVQAGKVLENFVIGPVFNVLKASVIRISLNLNFAGESDLPVSHYLPLAFRLVHARL